MATKRRGGGGFRPPELKGTLGTLLRTTWQQAGVVRDALERGAREGRSRLDEARAKRQRQDALAELGEIVLDLIRRGEIDLGELPEARDLVRDLDELDAEVEDEPVTRPRTRSRFDERAKQDDGTVSSGARAHAKPHAHDHAHPHAHDHSHDHSHDAPAAAAAPAKPRGRTLPPDPHRKGGITFDDDDLGEYMNPDDVPKREDK